MTTRRIAEEIAGVVTDGNSIRLGSSVNVLFELFELNAYRLNRVAAFRPRSAISRRFPVARRPRID